MRRALVVAIVLVAFASCKEPTQVIVEARTNIPHRGGLATTFTVGTPAAVEKAEPTTETREPWGADGFIGSLVVVPGTTDDASLSVKLVMGVLRDVRECSAPTYEGCIVVRRRLRYAPNERLHLPIGIYARCVNVPCDADSTCNALGLCVSSEIDPGTCGSAGGCKVPGDDTPPPTAVDPDASIALDAAPDASADEIDGGDAGDVVSVVDGGAPTPGYVHCPGAPSDRCATTNGTFCCWNHVTSIGACSTDSLACYELGRPQIACDDDSDCSESKTCCYISGAPLLGCQADCSGMMNGTKHEVCHVVDSCPVGQTCSGQVFSYYSICQ